jgi:ATP-dependent helicase HrpB
VPSGLTTRLGYKEDGAVRASAKPQELFGLTDTARIAPRQEPLLLALLALGGRPVQITRDLRSFWSMTYQEVRKELRARCPKHDRPLHAWPASPTKKGKRRTNLH